MPSDNKIKQKRQSNPKIRVIDGNSFYALATGEENALEKMYQTLPFVIAKILNIDPKIVTKDKRQGFVYYRSIDFIKK